MGSNLCLDLPRSCLLSPKRSYLSISIRSAILIDVAIIGYVRQPTFEVQPPNCPTMEERIAYAMLLHPTLRKALVDEGMNPELSVGGVLRSIKEREQAAKARERQRSTTREGGGRHKGRSRL